MLAPKEITGRHEECRISLRPGHIPQVYTPVKIDGDKYLFRAPITKEVYRDAIDMTRLNDDEYIDFYHLEELKDVEVFIADEPADMHDGRSDDGWFRRVQCRLELPSQELDGKREINTPLDEVQKLPDNRPVWRSWWSKAQPEQ